MNLSELKEKIKTALKEDSDEPHEKYDFRQSLQYRLMGTMVGILIVLALCQAVYPTLLTEQILTPVNGGFTILNLFPFIIVGYVLIVASESFGCFLIDKGLQLATDIRNRAGFPTYFNDSIIVLAILVFILYKVMFPMALGGVR